MSCEIQEILKNLGWDSGFQIPVANEENKKLEKELACLTLYNVNNKNSFELTNQRFTDLKVHNTNIFQEKEQNQNLIETYKQQVSQERDQINLYKHDKMHLSTELKKITFILKNNVKTNKKKRQTIAQDIKKLERLKIETKWDEEAVSVWEESERKKDEDNEAMLFFLKEDQIKFNELEARRQILQTEVLEKSQTVQNFRSISDSYEKVLDRTGKVIKQQILERNSLISQWKHSVCILHERDHEINIMQTTIITNIDTILSQQKILHEEFLFLENEKNINKDLKIKIEQLIAASFNYRKVLNDYLELFANFASEMENEKFAVVHLAEVLKYTRKKNKILEEEICQLNTVCANLITKNSYLYHKLKKRKSKQILSSDRIQKLKMFNSTEEKQKQKHLKQCDKIKTMLSQMENSLLKQKNNYFYLNNELTNRNSITMRIQSGLKEINKIKLLQTEKIYDLNYKIDKLQEKFLALEESVIDSKQEVHTNYTQNLENKVLGSTEKSNILRNQMTKTQEEMHRLNSAIMNGNKKLKSFMENCENQSLIQTICEKEIIRTKSVFQQLRVRENFIRLKVVNLEENIKKVEKTIFSMQKIKLNLEQCIKERIFEIQATRDVLLAKRQNIEEDKNRLKSYSSFLVVTLNQLKVKYQLILPKIENDKGDTNEVNMFSFKIQQAEEKFVLYQEGDALDNDIKIAEKEIAAMENTLKILNITNYAFRQTFK